MTETPPGTDEGNGGHGHDNCRVGEFVRWSRVMLEHERAHLSRCMAASAFLKPEEQAALMHDLADIDWALTYHEKRIQTPGEG